MKLITTASFCAVQRLVLVTAAERREARSLIHVSPAPNSMTSARRTFIFSNTYHCCWFGGWMQIRSTCVLRKKKHTPPLPTSLIRTKPSPPHVVVSRDRRTHAKAREISSSVRGLVRRQLRVRTKTHGLDARRAGL